MAVKILNSVSNHLSLKNLISEIGKCDLTNLKEKNIVLVKDNFSLTVEKDILQSLGLYGTFNIDVLSFSRLLLKLKDVSFDKNYLTSFGGVMIICKVVLSHAEKLLCYSKSSAYIGFYKRMYEFVQRLKSAGVTTASLQANESYPTLLKNKLHDILLIFSEYEKEIESNFFDENTKLDILSEVILSNPKIANYNIFLTNFDSYTKKDYKVLRSLVAKAKNVVFSTVTDTSCEVYPNNSHRQIISLLTDMQVQYEEVTCPIFENDTAEKIRQHLYAYDNYTCNCPKNLRVYEANDFEDEIENVAANIMSIIKSGGRFSDIVIACQDHDGYRNRMEKVFAICGIPYYLPTSMTLACHYAIKLISDISENDRNGKSAIALCKNPLCGIDFECACKYENYLLKYGYKKVLKYESDDFETIKAVHESVHNIISQYQMGVYSAKQHVKNMHEFFEKISLQEKLQKYAKFQEAFSLQQSSFTEQVFEHILQILSQIEFVYGDFFLKYDDFLSIFLSGVSAVKISVIPMSSDCVIVGSINDIKFNLPKHLFIIGFNADNFPPTVKDFDLLTANDLVILRDDNLDFLNLEYINSVERFNTYLLLQSFQETLSISYSRLSSVGGNTSRSQIIDELLSIFQGLYVENREFYLLEIDRYAADSKVIDNNFICPKMAAHKFILCLDDFIAQSENYKKYYSSLYHALCNMGLGEEIDRYVQVRTMQNIDNGFELFFYNGSVSATTIESFYTCPYMNFLQKGLRLFEREQFDMNSLDIGNYLHEVVEIFSKSCKQLPLDENACKQLVDSITEGMLSKKNYERLCDDKASMFMLDKLKKEAYKVCYHILRQLRKGKFEVKYTEFDFSKSGIDIVDKITLSGKIDRVDSYENFVRIIDYKSGNIDTNLNNIYLGTRTQLNLYLKQFDTLGYDCVGGFYFPMHNEFTDSGESDYRLKGRMIEDEKIIELFDSNIESSSDIISVYKGKEGYKSRSHGYLLPKESFKSSMEYSYIMAQKAVQSIKNGNISISPVDKACEYCPSKVMCEYDKMQTKCRKLESKIAFENIVKAVQINKTKQDKEDKS